MLLLGKFKVSFKAVSIIYHYILITFIYRINKVLKNNKLNTIN